jgi:hypothetical protein
MLQHDVERTKERTKERTNERMQTIEMRAAAEVSAGVVGLAAPGAVVVDDYDSAPKKSTSVSLGDLDRLSSEQTCPEGLVRMGDIHKPESHDTSTRKIPKIVFQTSRSRCVPERMAGFAEKWKFEGWSYYFFDDEAMLRLLREFHEEFPHLAMVQEHCIMRGTMRADLWRYLVLWKYGGIYVDLDSGPGKLWTDDLIKDDDDGFFVVDIAHLLSQYFFAVSPKHPLMYYAVEHVLLNLLKAPDTGTLHVAHSTGPWAIHFAFVSFLQDAGVKRVGMPPFKTPAESPVKAGKFYGPASRSITVVGQGKERSDDYVRREVIAYAQKLNNYKAMNMTHHRDDQKLASNAGCINSMYRQWLLKQP